MALSSTAESNIQPIPRILLLIFLLYKKFLCVRHIIPLPLTYYKSSIYYPMSIQRSRWLITLSMVPSRSLHFSFIHSFTLTKLWFGLLVFFNSWWIVFSLLFFSSCSIQTWWTQVSGEKQFQENYKIINYKINYKVNRCLPLFVLHDLIHIFWNLTLPLCSPLEGSGILRWVPRFPRFIYAV